MKELWSSRIQELVPYTPGEQPRDQSLIKLNTNENPYPPSPKALEAIRAAADASLRLYPDPECTALRQALAEYHHLAPGQIFVGNGSDEVLALCFQAFFGPERPVLFADITYSFYPVFAQLYGIPYQQTPLDEQFLLPVEPFCGENGGVVLANPNAPTGIELPLAHIRQILEASPRSVVLVDEAYVDFGGQTATDLIGSYPNLVIVRTLSKSRSLAGLRVGYALANAPLIEALGCVKNSFNSYPVDRLAQAGAVGAVQDLPYFHAALAKLITTRDRTADCLRTLGFSICESAANFLFLTHERVPAKVLLDGLRERGILVRWWDKPRISNYLRISIGTDADMEKLCTALSELVQVETPGAVH